MNNDYINLFKSTNLEHRVTKNELDMNDIKANLNILTKIVANLTSNVDNLQIEMKEFKDEMKEFKDEMKEFKDEMKDYQIISEQNRKAEIREWNKNWGELANKMGTIVEDIVAPSMPRISKMLNCDEILLLAKNIKKRKPSDKKYIREFDLILECEKFVIINETKSTPNIEKVNSFINFKDSNEFLEYFPEYKSKDLYYIFSALSLDESLVEVLSKNKIFAMQMGDSYMEIINFEDVKVKN